MGRQQIGVILMLPILDTPSFLGGLGKGLGEGMQKTIPSIAEMFMNRKKQEKQQELIKSILGGGSPSTQVDLSGSTPTQPMQGLEITPEKILAISSVDPQMGATMSRIYAGQEKERMNTQKSAEEKKVGQDAFNRMAELLQQGNLGMGSETLGKVFGGKTAEDVGEFSSLTGALEAMLVDRVSRGTLSNSRFKYITETLLPKATDRQATIKGKLKALSRELGLDATVLSKKGGAERRGSDFVLMRTPDGKSVKVPRDKIAEAQKAGGKVIQ